jgi:hypothetical protein
MAENKAITPPSLFGMERKMAYAHKKYHSGLMWVGVDNGLAGMKLSGSRNRSGVIREIVVAIKIRLINPMRSLEE